MIVEFASAGPKNYGYVTVSGNIIECIVRVSGGKQSVPIWFIFQIIFLKKKRMLKECFEHIERGNMPSMDELITRAKIIEVYYFRVSQVPRNSVDFSV